MRLARLMSFVFLAGCAATQPLVEDEELSDMYGAWRGHRIDEFLLGSTTLPTETRQMGSFTAYIWKRESSPPRMPERKDYVTTECEGNGTSFGSAFDFSATCEEKLDTTSYNAARLGAIIGSGAGYRCYLQFLVDANGVIQRVDTEFRNCDSDLESARLRAVPGYTFKADMVSNDQEGGAE